MADGQDKGKDADSITTAKEYRNFKALLRKIIKAPPLPRKWHNSVSPRAGNPHAPGRKKQMLHK